MIGKVHARHVPCGADKALFRVRTTPALEQVTCEQCLTKLTGDPTPIPEPRLKDSVGHGASSERSKAAKRLAQELAQRGCADATR